MKVRVTFADAHTGATLAGAVRIERDSAEAITARADAIRHRIAEVHDLPPDRVRATLAAPPTPLPVATSLLRKGA